jgi:hypothetical protein
MPPRKDTPADPSGRVPSPGTAPDAFRSRSSKEVKLPAGGRMGLATDAEVTMWNETMERYIADYQLTKANDLVQLGGILSQALMAFRAQMDLNDPEKQMVAQATIKLAMAEIRAAEKALGVDKATREKGGQHTVADYVTKVKRAGHAMGIHISERVTEYERVFNDVSVRIRVLDNGDQEDRDYHRVTDKTIVDFMRQEVAKLHEWEKEWSKQQGAIWVGRL